MLDFLDVFERIVKRDTVEIYPEFKVEPSKDLMIKGSHFYAIWDAENNLWSTDWFRAVRLIDQELKRYAEENKERLKNCTVHVLYLRHSSNGSIDKWIKFTTKQFDDNWKALDEKILFANDEPKRSDYASKRLPYPLEKMDTPNYNELTSVLYSPDELKKIEWAIGAIITGDSKKLQKFEVLYGSGGTGKGTILGIIKKLFDGYCCTFNAKALGSSSESFALEPFKNNPLVGIDFDGELSRIEDNTRINTLVSHEELIVNEKFRSTYPNRFKCFLFMGTNKPVKITDAKSGLIRRLIDVSPTGNKVPTKTYERAIEGIEFELPGIAWHCREVYLENKHEYDEYIPVNMLGATNDFYNFVEENYDTFKAEDSTTLKAAWEMYKNYCEEARVTYPYNKKAFKEELKNYFRSFEERSWTDSGCSVYNLYSGFKFRLGGETIKKELKKLSKTGEWLNLQSTESLFDIYCKDYPAQYATSEGIPSKKWVNCSTKLSDIKTNRLHYVKIPENLIVIDFDIPNEKGEKDLQSNIEAASKWPATYAEFSKSGTGLHLHYIYKGDTSKLSSVYSDHIEIKVFTGNSALRRKLTFCNDLPIAEISTGLPMKGEAVTNFDGIVNEKAIRTLIKRNLNKEYQPGTKPSVDFIKKILDDAYASNVKYDVSDMRNAVLSFAGGSSHHSAECVKLVGEMKFKSQEILDDEVDLYPQQIDPPDPTPIFFDCEVFPNLFLINWKRPGKDEKVVRMINPTPVEVEELMHHNLIGFNCRRYDNHMLYARMMGYSNEQLYRLSQRIIKGEKDAFFGEAYNVSYTDIYDYCSKKQSLKKWEIELGITHLELGLPWDQPVPEELWLKVAEYCDNDVISTEAVWDATQGDFLAREILADLAGGIVNDTTNTLTTRLIFGNNKKPQSSFNYRNLGEKPKGPSFTWKEAFDYASGKTSKKPEGQVWFPGYVYNVETGISSYRDVDDVGEGGYVFSLPGSYGFSETNDVRSMHPFSISDEVLFGEEYTRIFKELVEARGCIKHKDFEAAGKLFDGRLSKYLTDPAKAKSLAQALKIAVNSVYGLTAAKFPNPFRDERNIDNIVAKRGALFMIDMRNAVQSLGYTVIHVKTDSIKIANPDEFIHNFVNKFGECYGYEFEVEDEWDRICLIDKAQYIGRTKDGEWKATGEAFQHPYIFKTLFTHEDIVFDDLCETKAVSKGALYLDMEDGSEMKFVGRVGRFCPMINGGILYRVNEGKNYAAAGTKGYKWLESEVVKALGKEDEIDISYFDKLLNEAKGSLIAFSKIDDFLDTSKPYVYEMPESGEVPFMNQPEVSLELPFR